jgi:hypothetical protein
MVSVRIMAFAGAASVLATGANAADMPQLLPPPVPYYEKFAEGWYLRGCTTCPGGGGAHGNTASKFNFAWAAHAGISSKLTTNVAIEFAYRYVDLGDALSGDLTTYLGQHSVNNPMYFRGLTSQDFKLGVRYEPRYDYPPPPPAPLMLRG